MSELEFQDDPTIADRDPLWRRIHPEHLVPDGQGGVRISSAAFSDSSNGHPMSVTLGLEVMLAAKEPASCLRDYPDFGLAAFSAGLARENRQGIQRDPTEDDPAHALVFGPKTGSIRKKLARAATEAWVVQPPAHVIDARRRA